MFLITIGIVIYISFLFSVFQKMTPSIQLKRTEIIRWFIILNIIGWIGFTVGTNILTIKMVLDKQVSLMHNWHLFLVDSFILFTILPICFWNGFKIVTIIHAVGTHQMECETIYFNLQRGCCYYHFGKIGLSFYLYRIVSDYDI